MLAFVNYLHQSPCLRKAAFSRERGTEWGPDIIRTLLIRNAEFGLGTDSEVLKLSSLAVILSRPAFQATGASAVIETLIQNRNTFDSEFSASFEEARVADTARITFLSGRVQSMVEWLNRGHRLYTVQARRFRRLSESSRS